MKHYAKINIVLHLPADSQSAQALAQRLAEIHADAVIHNLNSLPCTDDDKDRLIKAIIDITTSTS